MKKLISLLLAVSLAFSCFALAGSAFWGGAMPDLQVGTYNAADCKQSYVLAKNVYKGSDGSTSTSTYTYDENGNLLKTVYKSGGKTSTTTYTYDANGNILKRAFKGSGYGETETFAYSSGRLKKQTYEMVEGTYSSKGAFTYSYNAKGLLTKKAYAAEDGSYKYAYYYYYNDAGFVSKIVYKAPGSDTNTTTYTYNSKNRVTKTVSTGGGETSTTKYTYDTAGNVIKTVCDSPFDYAAYTTTRTYGEKGNLLTEKTVTGTGESYTTTKTYNAKGLLTKEAYKSSEGTGYSWTLKYDANGNAIQETFTSDDGKAVSTNTYKKLAKPVVQAGAARLSYAVTTYTGKAKKPVVQVNGASKGADYRVVYSNNVKPGVATVKIIFNNPEMGAITVKFQIRPVKPAGLKVSAKTKTSLTLTWGQVTGAKSYVLYRVAADGTYKKLASVTGNKATVKSLKAGTAYSFRVLAVAAGGVKSAYSAKLTAKTAS